MQKCVFKGNIIILEGQQPYELYIIGKEKIHKEFLENNPEYQPVVVRLRNKHQKDKINHNRQDELK